MKLVDVYNTFADLKNQQFVFSEGFATPHSYRGNYSDVAFEPQNNVTVESVMDSINLAYDEVFEGYKVGEYSYNSDTRTHLAHYGNSHPYSVEHMENLVKRMLKEYNAEEGKPVETKTAEIDVMIEVLKAYKEGKKIQCRAKVGGDLEWVTESKLDFNFGNIEYRVAPELYKIKFNVDNSEFGCTIKSANRANAKCNLELTFEGVVLVDANVV